MNFQKKHFFLYTGGLEQQIISEGENGDQEEAGEQETASDQQLVNTHSLFTFANPYLVCNCIHGKTSQRRPTFKLLVVKQTAERHACHSRPGN